MKRVKKRQTVVRACSEFREKGRGIENARKIEIEESKVSKIISERNAVRDVYSHSLPIINRFLYHYMSFLQVFRVPIKIAKPLSKLVREREVKEFQLTG